MRTTRSCDSGGTSSSVSNNRLSISDSRSRCDSRLAASGSMANTRSQCRCRRQNGGSLVVNGGRLATSVSRRRGCRTGVTGDWGGTNSREGSGGDGAGSVAGTGASSPSPSRIAAGSISTGGASIGSPQARHLKVFPAAASGALCPRPHAEHFTEMGMASLGNSRLVSDGQRSSSLTTKRPRTNAGS